jgi:hypothetical protein
MRIAEGVDVKLAIFDIETPRGVFDIGIFNPDTGEWHEFEISEYRNDLYKLVKFYTAGKFDFWVSFNGIGFDHQVLQYIMENYEDWHDLDPLEITRKISDFASKVIDDGKYNIKPPYSEEDFPVKCIDVFRIHHFDNESKRTSLKWCAFMMNMDVEEMPHHHEVEKFSPEMITELKDYRRNDVLVTYELLKLTLGITTLEELKDYKGKNKIQDRIDVMRETGMPCLNWNDVKIGEEWNKKDYIEAEGIRNPLDLFPKKVKQTFGQKFRMFFPKSLNFQTKSIKDFISALGEEFIKNKKQLFPITVGKTTYTIAKGGIHSTETARKIIPPAGVKLTDIDVQSQYPNAFIKFRACPPHLKPSLYEQVAEKVEKRVELKNIARKLVEEGKLSESRPYSSVQEMLKLSLNGGLYGKLGQDGSFLEYPEGVLKICMGNQIEILMLIERMELAGFTVVSGNTDGIVVLYPETKEKEFLEVCKQWELAVGNTKLGKLEHNNFKAFWQESVNHYIGLKVDGKLKKKGRFSTEFELNKNKSARIIPLALEKYFIERVNPIEFITAHDNIYDFCIAKKSSKDLHYEQIKSETETIVLKKLIRYYASKDGDIIKKRGKDQSGRDVDSYCEAPDKDFPWMGTPRLTYFNKAVTYDSFSKYNVDYSFYILETLKRIDRIEKTDKAKIYANTFKIKQLGLF